MIKGKKTIKALLSISDGRAASFFNTLYKDYNTAAFFIGSGFSGAKIRRKTEKIGEFKRKSEKNEEKRRIICKFLGISVRIIWKYLIKIIQIMAASVGNQTDVVRCFTQPFCTFAYEKTRSMIPRDFRTEVWLVEGTPIPKQSRNIPETIPKDR